MLTSAMIGSKISQARKGKNLSQAQLARQLSVSSQAVGKWERGESMPDIITFNRLAEILEVDLNYFSDTFQPVKTQTASAEHLDKQSTELLSGKQKKKHEWNMSKGNWVDGDFSGLGNLNEKFSSSNLQRCLFVGSEMSGLLLKSNHVDSCNFTHSNISSSNIQNSNLVSNIFRDCSLKNAEFTGSYIKGCDFSGADFTDVIIKSSALLKSKMDHVLWNRTAIYTTQFADIIISGPVKDCSFENCDFTGLTFQNVTFKNTFFKIKSLKKSLKRIRFIDCMTYNLTYAFLKN
ncbi:MAG: pentapeptide repeat-containing protein, partial [Clostridia bacterium]|nr:pentapeptide repeat-containing protein [Clostridia bacterium]